MFSFLFQFLCERLFGLWPFLFYEVGEPFVLNCVVGGGVGERVVAAVTMAVLFVLEAEPLVGADAIVKVPVETACSVWKEPLSGLGCEVFVWDSASVELHFGEWVGVCVLVPGHNNHEQSRHHTTSSSDTIDFRIHEQSVNVLEQ